MEAFKSLTSAAIPLDRPDIDTDQIIPAQYMKRIERSGYGRYLFDALRRDPDFVLNDARYEGAKILVAGRNFGCGSSREHAPWALEDYGIRAIIAPSFADIFRNNCVNVGIVTIVLEEDTVKELIERSTTEPAAEITVDLERCEVRAGDDVWTFEVDAFHRERLLKGLDHIDLTLQYEDAIAAHERRRARNHLGSLNHHG
ncbi:MAG: 3-isopropylmalate dehydratase small subunit [Acidimicrobiia bacterium]|nr:3-isopropylmalate dehydratase small subunit [Acidimicrobiia bacterium]